jgi:uncharacterized hydrophobic protein (TIGR00271 family)
MHMASLQPAAAAAADALPELLPAPLDDLYPEGEVLRRSLQTYVALLALAACIASFGLYQDSVAAIIGAMVVAPLGGAIMAFAGALVTARLQFQRITLAEIVLGGAMVVAIGFVMSWLLPDPLFLTPSLEARTAPGLLDLGVAITAGTAGAIVAARRTGTDALPGVAIAVSLVPPLATVGICLELARYDDAAGAMLLFLTNFAGIVMAACVVFILAGAKPLATEAGRPYRVRYRVAGAAVLLTVIAIPLALQATDTVRTTLRAASGAPLVLAWIGERDLTVVDWSIDGDEIVLELTGSDPPPDPATLATDLATTFEAPVQVRLIYTPTQVLEADGTP